MIVVDLDKILGTENLPTYIYRAAKELKDHSYMTTGDFFKMLDDADMYEITRAIDSINSKDFREFFITDIYQTDDLKELSLLCFLLSAGEGEAEITGDVLPLLLANLQAIATIESMHRENKVKAIRENYSLLDTNKVIAKRNV